MKYTFTLLPFFFCLLAACIAQDKTALTADEFEKGISKDSVQVLDVRTPGEYQSGHIKNALLADWKDVKEFERRISFIDKDKPVYVYCLAGGRSAAAAEKMRKEGYTKIYELTGGINAWKAASKKLEGVTAQPQMSLQSFNDSLMANKLVLVDFGAEWCPPCKKMEPVIKNVLTQNKTATLLKVNGGNDTEIMSKYGVTALPVFIIFKEGKQIWRKEGVATEKELLAQLQQN